LASVVAAVAAVVGGTGGGGRRGSSRAGGGGTGSVVRVHKMEESQSQEREDVEGCVRNGLRGAVGVGRGAMCFSSLLGSEQHAKNEGKARTYVSRS
jgi:hypothetical protein